MNKRVFVSAAAITVACFAATTAQSMNIGSLSRQRPAIASPDLAALAVPAICLDRACGSHNKTDLTFSPTLHHVFASVSGWVHTARLQFIGVASAD